MTKVAFVCAGVLALVLGAGRASAAVYDIHVGGTCGTQFTNGPGAASDVGHWDGEVSVDAWVDQRYRMSTAVADLKNTLDRYCQTDWCWVYTYSNGAAVVSKVLATYGTPWRIISVRNSASNEGGTEIAGTGWIADLFGGCQLAGSTDLLPSAQRNYWNHNDTHGVPVIHIGGTGTIWWTLGLSHLALPGDDDTVVAFHSSGGMSVADSFYDLCAGPKYANHLVWSDRCAGEPEDHHSIARKLVCIDGGC